jgi:hypothetical protein
VTTSRPVQNCRIFAKKVIFLPAFKRTKTPTNIFCGIFTPSEQTPLPRITLEKKLYQKNIFFASVFTTKFHKISALALLVVWIF